MANVQVTCSACATVFETTKYKAARNKKHFCSRDCFNGFNKIDAKCHQCQSPMVLQKYKSKYDKHFCSEKCQRKWRQSQKVKRTCLICQKNFLVSPSTVERSGAKYCSAKCKNKSIDTRINKQCPVCQKQFLAKPCNIKRGKDTYCSNKCAQKGEERTKIETIVSEMLDDTDVEYTEQYPIGRYICDFYIAKSNLVIEADGEYWHNLPKVKKSDERKNKYLKQHGYNLLRLPGDKIRNNPDWCKKQILSHL